MNKEHAYRVAAWWTSGRTGLAKSDSAPNAIHFTAPAEFGGLEGRWTPEELLLAAVAGCYTTTVRAIAGSDGAPGEGATGGIRHGRNGGRRSARRRPARETVFRETSAAGVAFTRCHAALRAVVSFHPGGRASQAAPFLLPLRRWRGQRVSRLG